jgi:hypothetical protein
MLVKAVICLKSSWKNINALLVHCDENPIHPLRTDPPTDPCSASWNDISWQRPDGQQ